MSGLPGADAAISERVFPADDDQRPHKGKLNRDRRPERSGGDAEPVAEARLAVYHGEREVLDERRIL